MPHRLEAVRELNGVRWYNNSIATTPERVMAAVESFSEPLVLLLGGRDKDLPWESWLNWSAAAWITWCFSVRLQGRSSRR